MKKLQFTISINASKAKIWSTLWDDATYRQWTSAFTETSYAESDWQEGSSVLFLNGDCNGMYSEIAKLIPNEYMSFRHLGEIKAGVKVPSEGSELAWGNMYENYTLTDDSGTTTLAIEVDMPEAFAGFFEKTFPVAINKIKEIAEAA